MNEAPEDEFLAEVRAKLDARGDQVPDPGRYYVHYKEDVPRLLRLLYERAAGPPA